MQKTPCTILVVDDNEDILAALSLLLEQEFELIITSTDPGAIPALQTAHQPDILLLDMNFSAGINSGNEGLYWLNDIMKQDPKATVVLMTAYAEIELAVQGMRAGAVDFIEKPWEDEKLIVSLKNAFRLRKSEQKIRTLEQKQHLLQNDLQKRYEFVIGDSEVMKDLDALIDKVAATEANILILGENGSGKELIAREIHRRSSRSTELFVSVDLSSIPETLIESELFGHTKGAFTGASEDRIGRFEMAEGGTLLLDEIGNIPLSKQVKLLQVIQERFLTRIGSSKPIPLNFRLISATNSPIEDMVQQGSFREDLYYRLNTVTIVSPPLRERKQDIPALLNYFLQKYSSRYLKPDLSVSQDVIDHLSEHHWPGNIRELDHAVERAVILGNSSKLSPQEFRTNMRQGSKPKQTESLNLKVNEWSIIQRAIQESSGNLSLAAKLLGISRKTLYNKIEKHRD